ncbi:hypothetical protein [Phormidesmis priestleyi]|nr:hypothetical protein [Phormidesmis priestleyi]
MGQISRDKIGGDVPPERLYSFGEFIVDRSVLINLPRPAAHQ